MTEKQYLAAGLLISKDTILMVKEAYGLHLWTLPSGYVEPGESFSQAAVREVLEETGLETQVMGVIAVRERPDQLIIAFSLQPCGGELLDSVPGEIEATKWFSGDDLENEKHQVNDFAAALASRALEHDLPVLKYEHWTDRFGAVSAWFSG